MFQLQNPKLQDLQFKDSMIRRLLWDLDSAIIEKKTANNGLALTWANRKLERLNNLLVTLRREQAEMYSAYILSELTPSDFDYIPE